MEKESEILLATGSSFYYDGVPQIKSNEYKENTIYSDITNMENVQSINCMVNTGLSIAQFICIALLILCVFKGISNFMKNRKDVDELNLEDDEKPKKKLVFPYVIASGVLAWFAMLAQIIKNFSAKPIIYIYPEEETEVKIKVKNPEKLTCTYPKYEDSWNVLAKPNGDLIDLKSNRKLYALYWEGINTTKVNLDEGFIVEGESVAKFLEEKLEILGLNEREAEEFIVYWLPLMEKNKYNYIRFETLDEINENMGLKITPKPETLIRINMEIKGLTKPMTVKEQNLKRVERKGYTVVEWGGTKI